MNHIFTSLNDLQLARMIADGSIGVIPTDTVYGIVARASNENAVKRLYNLKKREKKPGTLIAASKQQLVELGIKKRYLTSVEHLWPNSLSIVLPVGKELAHIHQGIQSLAIRIPNHEGLQQLLSRTGPLLTSSANAPKQAPATTLKEAQTYFGDKIDFYVDGGDLSGHLPSTIIRVVDDAIEVLREGSVKIDEETGRIL